jgi:hypothetical protein
VSILETSSAPGLLPDRFVRWFASRGWAPEPLGAARMDGTAAEMVEAETDQAARAAAHRDEIRNGVLRGTELELQFRIVCPLAGKPS